MKKTNKNLRLSCITAVSVLAALCLLFAACSDPNGPDPDDPDIPEEQKVATPVASPGPGTVLVDTEVTLTSTTEDAIIRYTINGNNPNTSSSAFNTNNPIIITGNMTIKAIAYKSGMTPSDMLEAVYTVGDSSQVTAPPSASPGPGAVYANTPINLSSATPDAVIRYTLNGDAPTATTGTVFTTAITFTEATTIRAIATKEGLDDSSVVTFAYTIREVGGHFTDNYALNRIISIGWSSEWGQNRFDISAYNANQMTAMRNVPSGSYYRVTFEDLGENWPEFIHDGWGLNRRFTNEFVRFLNDNQSEDLYITFEELGPVTAGKGEAFFDADPVTVFVTEKSGFGNGPIIKYFDNQLQGQHGNPKMIANGNILNLEVWSPTEGTVVKTGFQSVIGLTKDILESVVVADGINSAAEKFVTQGVWNAFNTAIEAAEDVDGNAGATQAQINAAVFSLIDAWQVFESLIQSVDKSSLIYAVNSAENLLNSVIRSDIEPGGGQYAFTVDWDAFEEAIGTAQAVIDNPGATAPQVNGAVTALATARTEFESKIRTVSFNKINFQNSGTTIVLKWDDYFGQWSAPPQIGYIFFLKQYWAGTAASEFTNLAPNAYIRIEIEGLGTEWPANMPDNFLTLNTDTGSPRIFLEIEYLGDIVDGKGEAFIAVTQFQDFINTTTSSGSFDYFFGYNNNPRGDVRIVENDDEEITLQVWVPIP